MDDIEIETMRRKLAELKTEHRDLDEIIGRVEASGPFDQLRIQKRKLVLKDQITKLESQLLPDIIA
jgi:hypothetical protein